MVLKEIEHVACNAIDGLPAVGEACCRYVVALYSAESIVEVDFVVEIVETAVIDVVAIEAYVVDFGDEYHMRVFFLHKRYCPFPELHGHHVSHVAAETVDSFGAPESEDVEHLEPCVRGGREVPGAVTVVDAIVELNGLVPVVASRESGEAVVSGGFGRKFAILVIAFAEIHVVWGELLT